MKPARGLELDPAAFEDLAWWIEQDRSKALRIINLVRDVQHVLSMRRHAYWLSFPTHCRNESDSGRRSRK